MMLYFVLFKSKKENDYKMFSNTLFDNEKEAEHFGKSSMKRGYEYKVIEYNKENYNRYWYK
jgi:NMD protein affecting ribosome stability and mRNA decay